jgi:hypothetical protein
VLTKILSQERQTHEQIVYLFIQGFSVFTLVPSSVGAMSGLALVPVAGRLDIEQ